MNFVQVTQTLTETELDVVSMVLYFEETIDTDGNVMVTNVFNDDVPMSMLTYGIEPRFYEFIESINEVKMSTTMKRESSAEIKCGQKFSLTNTSKISGSYSSGCPLCCLARVK